MSFMDFTNYDLLITACQHHHEVSKHATDVHRVRRSPSGRRSEWRSLGPPQGRPDAG